MFLKDANNFTVNKASTLTTARTINGTSFSGSANITTANWGTARTLTVGNASKSVNGSGNVSWSLSEIGAAASGHTHNYAGSSSAGGAANSATKLATARTINGTSFDGSANITTANWGTARTLTIGNTGKSVNGSGNVSWSLSEIGAAASNHTHSNYASTSHTHSSLTGTTGSTTAPSTGTGVMRYDYNVSSANAGTLPNNNNANGILTLNTHSGNYYNQLGFSSNGNLYYRAFNGKALDTTTAWKQIAFTDSNITGNAATATKLQTARTINGTNFDGTSNITTANWGTARTITIGSTGKSVNGSGNVSWSLSEIGAAAASHTHNYLPLTGGTLSGNVVLNNNVAIGGKDTSGTTKWLAWVDKANNAQFGDVAIKSVINSNANPEVNVGGKGIYTLYHTGNKPTAAEIGALPLTGGTLTGKIDVPGESTFYDETYTDPWENVECVIKASGNVGIGGALKVNRNLKVSEHVHSPILEANTDIILNRYDFKTYYTNNQHGSYIYCNKNSSYINLTDGKMTYANPNGNIEIGPQNSAHCHIYTDRPSFYFNKDLLVNGSNVWHTGNFNPGTKLDAGNFSISNRDLKIHGKRALVGFNTPDGNYLHLNFQKDFAEGVKIEGLLRTGLINSIGTSDAHGITIDSTGAYQNLYFKNNGAVRGLMRSLTNGSGVEIHCYDSAGTWKNNFILSTETGKALVNGRRLAAFDTSNPAHCIFRYGSGLGGAAGYITFSY